MRYDYECDTCGVFEVQQPMTADPLETCPDCQGEVRRLISGGVAIHFKGSGFYATDYRSGNGVSTAGSSSSTGEESGSTASDGG